MRTYIDILEIDKVSAREEAGEFSVVTLAAKNYASAVKIFLPPGKSEAVAAAIREALK